MEINNILNLNGKQLPDISGFQSLKDHELSSILTSEMLYDKEQLKIVATQKITSFTEDQLS